MQQPLFMVVMCPDLEVVVETTKVLKSVGLGRLPDPRVGLFSVPGGAGLPFSENIQQASIQWHPNFILAFGHDKCAHNGERGWMDKNIFELKEELGDGVSVLPVWIRWTGKKWKWCPDDNDIMTFFEVVIGHNCLHGKGRCIRSNELINLLRHTFGFHWWKTEQGFGPMHHYLKRLVEQHRIITQNKTYHSPACPHIKN